MVIKASLTLRFLKAPLNWIICPHHPAKCPGPSSPGSKPVWDSNQPIVQFINDHIKQCIAQASRKVAALLDKASF